MWQDISFDVRSFSPESFGPSWGLTWEAAQSLAEQLEPAGHWKHLFRPVAVVKLDVLQVRARAESGRIGVVCHTTKSAPEVIVAHRVFGCARIEGPAFRVGVRISFKPLRRKSQISHARIRCGASVFERQPIHVRNRVGAVPIVPIQIVGCGHIFGVSGVSTPYVRGVQNLPEEVLLALI